MGDIVVIMGRQGCGTVFPATRSPTFISRNNNLGLNPLVPSFDHSVSRQEIGKGDDDIMSSKILLTRTFCFHRLKTISSKSPGAFS